MRLSSQAEWQLSSNLSSGTLAQLLLQKAAHLRLVHRLRHKAISEELAGGGRGDVLGYIEGRVWDE